MPLTNSRGPIANTTIVCGTSPGAGNTATRIELDTEASNTDGAYDPAMVFITAGTGAGQARHIVEYDGANRYAYVGRDWKVTPDATSQYCIIADPGNLHVNEGVAQGGGAATITLNALASAQNNAYLGQMVYIVAGTGQDQARMVVGYVGATRVATVDSNWITQPDATSNYLIMPFPGFVHGRPAADSTANTLMRDVIGNKADTVAGDSLIALIKQALADTIEIASSATAGLADTANSLSYRVTEIERHLHSGGRWFETATTPDGELHVADRIGDGAGAFQIDAGNDDWGAWVQILGSDDTPTVVGKAFFDPHQMIVEATEVAGAYFIQIARGDSGAAGLAAGTYTELIFESDAVGQRAEGIIPVQTGRAPAGSKLWARTKAPGENTATIDFYFGLHEYEG